MYPISSLIELCAVNSGFFRLSSKLNSCLRKKFSVSSINFKPSLIKNSSCLNQWITLVIFRAYNKHGIYLHMCDKVVES